MTKSRTIICGSRRDEEEGLTEEVLDPQESPGEIKSREVEPAGLRTELNNLFLQLLLNSCAMDSVFVTLHRTAVETAISGVH